MEMPDEKGEIKKLYLLNFIILAASVAIAIVFGEEVLIGSISAAISWVLPGLRARFFSC